MDVNMTLNNGTDFNISGEHNAPMNSSAPMKRNERLAQIEIAVQAVIFVVAVLGNSFVLIVFACRRKKLSRMNLMVGHLCIADLFVAFFNVFPQMMWDITGLFQGGDFLCRIVKYFQVVAMYASSYVLITTAIDRWLVICHPLTTHTWSTKKLHMMVLVAWILSLMFGTPQMVIFKYSAIQGVYNCYAFFEPLWTMTAYITFITTAIYIVPFFVLAIAYGRICFVVWKSMKAKEGHSSSKKDKHENGLLISEGKNSSSSKSTSSNPRAHVRGGVSRAKFKTVKLTMTVIVCYLVCWGPFFIAQMWAAWDVNAPYQGTAMVIITLLASLNSCVNPWIYLAFSADTCKKVSHKIMGKNYEQSTKTPNTGNYKYKTSFTRTTNASAKTDSRI